MPDVPLRLGAIGPGIRRLQGVLRSRGYDPGPEDGVLSRRTMVAMQSALADMSGGSSASARRSSALGTGGIATDRQAYLTLAQGFALQEGYDRLTPAAPMVAPESAAQTITMTPETAARLDAAMGIGAPVESWGTMLLKAVGTGALGVLLWRWAVR